MGVRVALLIAVPGGYSLARFSGFGLFRKAVCERKLVMFINRDVGKLSCWDLLCGFWKNEIEETTQEAAAQTFHKPYHALLQP